LTVRHRGAVDESKQKHGDVAQRTFALPVGAESTGAPAEASTAEPGQSAPRYEGRKRERRKEREEEKTREKQDKQPASSAFAPNGD